MSVRIVPARSGKGFEYDIRITWPEGGRRRERGKCPVTGEEASRSWGEARERAIMLQGKAAYRPLSAPDSAEVGCTFPNVPSTTAAGAKQLDGNESGQTAAMDRVGCRAKALRERRAAALEAMAHALLELAAVERETEDDEPSKEALVEPGQSTASVPHRPDTDASLKAAHERFVARVGRPMTDQELHSADRWIAEGRRDTATPDDVAAHVIGEIGREPSHYPEWRSIGLDPAKMERDGEDLRERLRREHPEWTWRERQSVVYDMWMAVAGPLYVTRGTPLHEARAAKRAARDARTLAVRSRLEPGGGEPSKEGRSEAIATALRELRETNRARLRAKRGAERRK